METNGTANGDEHILKGQELKAGRVSLGQLGVVYSIKLGVRKNYYLDHHQELVTLKNENLKELLKNRHQAELIASICRRPL